MGSAVDEAKIVVSENEEQENGSEEKKDQDVKEIDSGEKKDETAKFQKKYTVVYVLGGPGGGKSTQCTNISKQIGFTHLSSGDLLRKARTCDPENGPIIESMIKEGESVPPELTMPILKKAMDQSGNDKFILDGFPRDEEIRAEFESATKTEPELVLFFDCPEEEREKRILSRNQGRVDDNPESLRKRFKYFEEHTLRVVEYYRSKGKVHQIDAGKSEEDVFETIKGILSSLALQSSDGEAEIEADGGIPDNNELGEEISKIKL